ncbi:MAG: hypothetical protein OXC37_03950 [Bdellovibrionaceae bacterium]|nr:hypothetical protein [Pseudobdellovibrionaceae bacterium]
MITDIYSLVEHVIGISLMIGGVVFIVNSHIPKALYNTYVNIEQNEGLIYMTAWMFLILGLITVLTHNDWYFGYSLIVTLFGWLVLVKAFLWLLLPKILIHFAKKMSFIIKHKWFHLIYGIIILILGLIVFMNLYMNDM